MQEAQRAYDTPAVSANGAPMLNATTLEILFIALAIYLAHLITIRPELTRARGGKIVGFLALCVLPAAASWTGFSEQMDRSKQTQFCLSCHIMSDYGRSLYRDDLSYLPAAHFQNNRIPRDVVCYTCHTTYSLYGPLQSKLEGLRHLYVQYLGTPPKPADIKLYAPFNNRECLHCHEGSRSFEEGSTHADLLPQIKSNEISCLTCHDLVHDVGSLADATFWKGPQP
jgi:nitrate/TMAO reductase-like tetraheme cytochrome c subunit